ncbi:hypothetical protein QQ73_08175, partial [Candidatus Endoriftia persephone str. Guaymas]|nr:hypothetical protein [Candidatus Endoriftia persephone str. Guaymas]
PVFSEDGNSEVGLCRIVIDNHHAVGVAPFGSGQLLHAVGHRKGFYRGRPERAGFSAHRLEAGLEALQTFKPDLILMDLYMPGASGTELTTVIREQPEYVDTPIVFLSGEQDLDKQLMALSFGGEDFLAKPIGPKHLISTVRNRIKRARAILRKSGTPSRRDIATDLYSRSYLFERIAALQSSGKDS